MSEPRALMSSTDAGGKESGRAHFGAPSLQVDVAAASDVGRVRENNEDSFAVLRIGRFVERVVSSLPESILPARGEESGNILMIADGMGGMAAGEMASRTVLATMVRLIEDAPQWTLRLDDPATRTQEIRDMWARGRAFLLEAHAALLRHAAEDPSLSGMGTTYTAAFQLGTDLFVWHVGDSRAYLLRGEHFERVTRDHTLAQSYIEQGMPESEAAARGFNHVLTQSLGGLTDAPDADLHGLVVAPGDRLLLCTDGLTNEVPDEEIARVLGGPGTSDERCRALIDLALNRGARDNVTAIVATFSAARGR